MYAILYHEDIAKIKFPEIYANHMQKKATITIVTELFYCFTQKSIKVYKKRTKVEEISSSVLHNVYRYIFVGVFSEPTMPNSF